MPFTYVSNALVTLTRTYSNSAIVMVGRFDDGAVLLRERSGTNTRLRIMTWATGAPPTLSIGSQSVQYGSWNDLHVPIDNDTLWTLTRWTDFDFIHLFLWGRSGATLTFLRSLQLTTVPHDASYQAFSIQETSAWPGAAGDEMAMVTIARESGGGVKVFAVWLTSVGYVTTVMRAWREGGFIRYTNWEPLHYHDAPTNSNEVPRITLIGIDDGVVIMENEVILDWMGDYEEYPASWTPKWHVYTLESGSTVVEEHATIKAAVDQRTYDKGYWNETDVRAEGEWWSDQRIPDIVPYRVYHWIGSWQMEFAFLDFSDRANPVHRFMRYWGARYPYASWTGQGLWTWGSQVYDYNRPESVEGLVWTGSPSIGSVEAAFLIDGVLYLLGHTSISSTQVRIYVLRFNESIGGAVWSQYDPVRDAPIELDAVGAPAGARVVFD